MTLGGHVGSQDAVCISRVLVHAPCGPATCVTTHTFTRITAVTTMCSASTPSFLWRNAQTWSCPCFAAETDQMWQTVVVRTFCKNIHVCVLSPKRRDCWRVCSNVPAFRQLQQRCDRDTRARDHHFSRSTHVGILAGCTDEFLATVAGLFAATPWRRPPSRRSTRQETTLRPAHVLIGSRVRQEWSDWANPFKLTNTCSPEDCVFTVSRSVYSSNLTAGPVTEALQEDLRWHATQT